jgi:hypothetical protein
MWMPLFLNALIMYRPLCACDRHSGHRSLCTLFSALCTLCTLAPQRADSKTDGAFRDAYLRTATMLKSRTITEIGQSEAWMVGTDQAIDDQV